MVQWHKNITREYSCMTLFVETVNKIKTIENKSNYTMSVHEVKQCVGKFCFNTVEILILINY